MNPLVPPDKKLFYSRQDNLDPRLGEQARAISVKDISKLQWHLVGYPDDEGIRLNGGRVGAALAPDTIRSYLYKMTPGLREQTLPLLDLGNFDTSAGDLNSRHQSAYELAESIFRSDGYILSLGGGHDYGFSDSGAFAKVFQSDNPLVINFDAHLDVRRTDQGHHSGTPFRRLLEAFPKISFVEIGIQNQCNSRTHLLWLKDQGGVALELDEILYAPNSTQAIFDFLLPHLDRPRPVFVSIDLDVFSSAYAPGCSQSWPTGLKPNDVLASLDFIKARSHLKGAGFYEVSPPLDVDDRTSRLTALLIHKVLTKSEVH